MTDDAKKLDEWRDEEAVRRAAVDGLSIYGWYRRLVVEDARPPEPVDVIEEVLNDVLGEEWSVATVVFTADKLRTELAARGLAVRPVVEMRERPPESVDDGLEEAIFTIWEFLAKPKPFVDALRAGFLLGGGTIGEAG